MISLLHTLFLFLVLLLIVILGVYFVILRNSQEPEVKRKWADPKFHD